MKPSGWHTACFCYSTFVNTKKCKIVQETAMEKTHVRIALYPDYFARLIYLVLVVLLFIPGEIPCRQKNSLPECLPEVIRLPDEAPWLATIVTPLLRKLRQKRKMPAIIFHSGGTLPAVARGNHQKFCVLDVRFSDDKAPQDSGLEPEFKRLQINRDPFRTGVLVAQKYWKKSRCIVMAPLEDYETLILSSVLAAHHGWPLVPFSGHEQAADLQPVLKKLRVRELFVVSDKQKLIPSFFRLLKPSVTVINSGQAQKKIVSRLKASSIRNIIVTSVQREHSTGEGNFWLASLLSCIRRAPVLFCRKNDPAALETLCRGFIDRHNLAIRTITILADYESIGVINHTYSTELEPVDVEPMSIPEKGMALSFGVGRIPFSSLQECSLLIARTAARKSMTPDQDRRVLMIANPNSDFGALPFCETVSRLTAHEFKNFSVDIDEFYACPPDQEPVVKSAETADLIIYEGHVTDQTLFYVPYDEGGIYSEPYVQDGYHDDYYNEYGTEFAERSWPGLFLSSIGFYECLRALVRNEYYRAEEWNSYEEYVPGIGDAEIYTNPDAGASEDGPLSETDYGYRDPNNPQTDEPQEDGQTTDPENRETDGDVYSYSDELYPEETEEPLSTQLVSRLENFPLVILQSCNSLDRETGKIILDLGGIGIVGSVTNIHSASGSSFIKAFCDNMLYRGATVGEALRDARNYFFCLADLKDKRNHKQTDKMRRVALSFRLWGDPEARIFPRGMTPRFRPVKAYFRGNHGIAIKTPKNRLSTARTPAYTVRTFPGSQTAGIVARMRRRQTRKLMPLYFFRKRLPGNFSYGQGVPVDEKGKSDRCAVLADEYDRYLYILYFPKDVEKNQEYKLEFSIK